MIEIGRCDRSHCHDWNVYLAAISRPGSDGKKSLISPLRDVPPSIWFVPTQNDNVASSRYRTFAYSVRLHFFRREVERPELRSLLEASRSDVEFQLSRIIPISVSSNPSSALASISRVSLIVVPGVHCMKHGRCRSRQLDDFGSCADPPTG
jgi:hypothetical protein